MEMNYCTQCGERLVPREHPGEGLVPYCPACARYRFPIFSTAVIVIALNPARDRVLLIRQYGKQDFILVAGYVNQGEGAEEAAIRELGEELGAEVTELRYKRSHFFPPSNTLMLNFTAVLAGEQIRPNREVDDWAWFDFDEALRRIKPGSLAEAFLRGALNGGVYRWPF